jgi:hypothetical protein
MTRQHSLPQDAPKGELLLARLKEEMKKIADNVGVFVETSFV